MNKPAKAVSFLVALTLLFVIFALAGAPLAYANENDDDEAVVAHGERIDAIRAANNAILRIPPISRIVSLEQTVVSYVAEARALVVRAMDDYGAVESDFSNLDRLEAAEWQIEKLRAIRAAKDAMDLLPPADQITEAHRLLVEEARRLVDIAMNVYGATRMDLCWRLDDLEDIEDEPDEDVDEEEPDEDVDEEEPDEDVDEEEPDEDVDEEDEEEPEEDEPEAPVPTPPTGGIPAAILASTLIAGGGLLLLKKQRRRL